MFDPPQADEARTILTRLTVPAVDIEEMVADLPSAGRDPDRWARLQAAYEQMTAGDEQPDWPPIEDDPWFHAHLFLAAVPFTRQQHAGWGVDEDITWATLAAIGRTIDIHRRMHGTGGVHFPAWFVRHIRGRMFRVGLLEYLRGSTWNLRPITASGARFAPGEPLLDLHIPEDRPLAPGAVDASFAQARAFFARHFPGDDSSYGSCWSWLLDPQLAEYLPEDSNIVRFQRRFRLVPEEGFPGNASVMEFVFRRIDPTIDGLPQDTTLQRAVVAHIRAGREWKIRRGWCEVGTGPLTV